MIRHVAMAQFWGKCLKTEEVTWDTFWLHFPTGLPPEVHLDTAFSSQRERAALQRALHVVGAPESVTASQVDAAFLPGCSLQENVSR